MSGQHGQRSVPWTASDLAILRAEYPKGGYRAVQARLPDRSETAIRGAANREQLHVAGRTYVKQPATEWIDAAIARAYRESPRAPDVAALAKRLGRTKGWVKWRAQELGVARRGFGAEGAPGTPWTPDEDALLESLIERGLTISTIGKKLRAAGYRRSLSAVSCRVYILGLRFERDFLTASDVARLLNIDWSVVGGWIAAGHLRARRESGPSAVEPSGKLWRIERTALRRFLIAHPRRWDHRRVRIEILLELLCGATEAGVGAFATGDAA